MLPIVEQNNGLLFYPVSYEGNECSKYCIYSGAPPNQQVLPAIEWLLSLGARADAPNRMGETPLIIAVQQRQPRIVRVLLDAGANPDKTDAAAGYSAREYAERDTRGRQILQMIEAKKPKASAKR